MITIYGEVPSSKNSRVFNTKIKRSFPSKFCRDYKANSDLQWKANRNKFLKAIEGKDKPYNIEFKFYRQTKRAFDYSNIVQIVQDLMVQHEWIEDDNCRVLKPQFAEYEVDKENPRVTITVI